MRTIIDPDARIRNLKNMPKAIAKYCAARNIPVPQSQGQIFRAIQESIALKYAYVFKTIESITGIKPDSINTMGGGSKDDFLNQFTADATNKAVFAGPTESTAFGNAIMQMKASGDISDLSQGRALVA
ncbi:MAG: FGGY-family carbohydrate kinase [Bacilli bacterium]